MKRFDKTLDSLFSIISEQQRTLQHLADLIVKLLKEEEDMKCCDVLKTESDLLDYLDQYDIDYILFITPQQPVFCMDREEIDVLSETGELKAVIAWNWKLETIAIPVP